MFYVIIKQKAVPKKSESEIKKINLTVYQVGGITT